MALQLLCAGAAKGIVLALEPGFRAGEGGAPIEARFGAVGAMREALRAGAACDVLVVTEAMLAELVASGEVMAAGCAPIGRVRTGVAAIAAAALPAIGSTEALRSSLLGASALYVPDTVRSTAGAHVARMLGGLGIEAEMAPRLRMFANGAAAMQALVDGGDRMAIGCTQISEILYTPGLTLAGALPAEYELATVYSAGTAVTAKDPARAGRFIGWLTGARSAALRLDAGFEP